MKVPLYGCDCYAYGLLAAGHVDLVVESGLKPYDYLASVPVVEGAGGEIISWDGQKLRWLPEIGTIFQPSIGKHRYCSEILSALPFGIPDEPLYVVYTINRVIQVRAGELEANLKSIITEAALGATTAMQVIEGNLTEGKRMEESALNPDFIPPEIKEEIFIDVVDTGGIPEDALDKLRGYCNSAMALALLLRLKRHVKIVYCLNDARC